MKSLRINDSRVKITCVALLVATPAVDLDGIYTQWRFWSYLVVHIHNRDPLFSFLPIYSKFWPFNNYCHY